MMPSSLTTPAARPDANIIFIQPVSWSRYMYVNGDPTNGRDSSGEYFEGRPYDEAKCGDDWISDTSLSRNGHG